MKLVLPLELAGDAVDSIWRTVIVTSSTARTSREMP